MIWTVFTLVSCLKLLFIPAYKSTDFEVHRNWLAITHSLPVSEWYTEATSQWTLDYPPFFAWFEWALSQVAVWFDPAMLEVANLEHSTWQTVLFQRLSVMVTDAVLAAGVAACAHSLAWSRRLGATMAVLILGSAGLFMVDHIHFQYNGFLSGLLLLSIAALAGGHYSLASLLFSALLFFKHIYLYLAPAFIVYMLRSHCFTSHSDGSTRWTSFSVWRLLQLAGPVLLNTALALGPFIHQLPQLLSRLFPFKRGLCHAYWAPNLWAVYNTVDRGLELAGRRAGLLTGPRPPSMTGGLVQDLYHAVLPSPSPACTALLTLLALLPALARLWSAPHSIPAFLRCLALSAWAAFTLGWHVHEKAILLVVLPLTLVAATSKAEARYLALLTPLAHLSLFPLLFTTAQLPTKVLASLSHCLLSSFLLPSSPRPRLESLYLLLSLPLAAWAELAPAHPTLPFLPLLAYSLYCSIGLLYTFIRVYTLYLTM